MEDSLQGYDIFKPMMWPLMFGASVPFVYCCSKVVVYLLWVRVKVTVRVRVRDRARARVRVRVRARARARVRVQV